MPHYYNQKHKWLWSFPVLYTPLLQQGHTQALIPWADFVNHDVACSAHIEWDATAGSVVLVADRDYQPGEQICEWTRSGRICGYSSAADAVG